LSKWLPPVLQLRPYQQTWIDDGSRFKGAVKSARIGFSFGTAAESVLDCLKKPNETWTILSHSKPGSREFIEEHVGKIKEAIGAVARLYSEPYADELGESDTLVYRADFPNGSRILALPSNPRTARGYPGNAVLDEFAHHEDSYAVWAAVTRQLALGHKLRVLSTPCGEQGKYFDLVKDAGLADGVAPVPNPKRIGSWSWHWVDALLAIAGGCPIDLAEMEQLFHADVATMQQEFFCVFLKAVGSWIEPELVARCEDDGCSIDWPAGYVPMGPLYAGIDVARDRNKSVLWLDEMLGGISFARMVLRLHDVPFFREGKTNDQARLFGEWIKRAARTAIDATGMGLGLYEFFNAEYPGRVIGINFAGSNDGGVKIKTDLAMRIKSRMEKGQSRIPRDMEIRQALLSVKRVATGTGVKFDAPQIEVDTPSGIRKKIFGHADEFWAKALADFAAGQELGTLGVIDWVRETMGAGMREKLQKPAVNESTDRCPDCNSTAIARVQGRRRCNQCGKMLDPPPEIGRLGPDRREVLAKRSR
jgi:phage FluMu gp28-like protein